MRKKPIAGSNKVVQDVLSASSKPLGAYEVLERVKEMGINGPPTVYRALDRLVKYGLAHRVASTRSYITCRHGAAHTAEAVLLVVCSFCDTVEEVSSKAIYNEIQAIRAEKHFKIRDEILEIAGICRNCGGGRRA